MKTDLFLELVAITMLPQSKSVIVLSPCAYPNTVSNENNYLCCFIVVDGIGEVKQPKFHFKLFLHTRLLQLKWMRGTAG